VTGVEVAERAATWAGLAPTAAQLDLLAAYAEWLTSEAIPAGGLGPREAERVWARHIADSLVFATAWRGTGPAELLDVGSGVGLPGIPLAIMWPEAYLTLLDRGGRRVRLLQRAIRVLALPRVRAVQGDVFAVADEWRAVASRGSVRPPEFVGLASRLLDDDGVAVLGLSRRAEPPERTQELIGVAEALGLSPELVGVPAEILDGPAWLLIMSRHGDDSGG
jgi:16S rRNA (guanine527-N7)-methyltransferase